MRFELVRRNYLKDRKTSSEIDVFEKNYMMDKCIDDCCLLIGVGSEYCTNYDLLIHFKCVELFGWKYNNYYCCCHDFMIGK